MKLTSTSFAAKASIPDKYTCQGEDINPALSWEDIPENTKSLAMIVDDPDAPRLTPWVHWIVYNIPPDTKGVEENSVPKGGKEGMTDFGKSGYGGPCPPSGTHRYYFTLYALDSMLEIQATQTKDSLLQAMQGHILAQAELIGFYQKK